MKKMYALAALLIAGFLAAAPITAETTTPTKLNVMSFNIRCLSRDDTGDNAWEVRKDCVLNMLHKEQPDVIGFQEPMPPQVAFLVSRLPQYSHVTIGREEGVKRDGGEHLMIMWRTDKYDLLDSGYFWLSDTPKQFSMGWDAAIVRISIWVKLRDKCTREEFYLLDTHLDYAGDKARYNGALLNVDTLKELSGEGDPVFVVGDMNSAYGTGEGKFLEPYYSWMQSARETAPETDYRPSLNNFDRGDSDKIIDYIFYRNAEAETFRTLDGDGYGVKYISDHFPVAATFKIN